MITNCPVTSQPDVLVSGSAKKGLACADSNVT